MQIHNIQRNPLITVTAKQQMNHDTKCFSDECYFSCITTLAHTSALHLLLSLSRMTCHLPIDHSCTGISVIVWTFLISFEYIL